MVTVEECKKILNRKANKYSDEEVEKIRDFLYQIGKIEYDNFIQLKQVKKNELSK